MSRAQQEEEKGTSLVVERLAVQPGLRSVKPNPGRAAVACIQGSIPSWRPRPAHWRTPLSFWGARPPCTTVVQFRGRSTGQGLNGRSSPPWIRLQNSHHRLLVEQFAKPFFCSLSSFLLQRSGVRPI